MIASIVQTSRHNFIIIDEKGFRKSVMCLADELQGYTSSTFSVKYNNSIIVYNEKGQQISSQPLGSSGGYSSSGKSNNSGSSGNPRSTGSSSSSDSSRNSGNSGGFSRSNNSKNSGSSGNSGGSMFKKGCAWIIVIVIIFVIAIIVGTINDMKEPKPSVDIPKPSADIQESPKEVPEPSVDISEPSNLEQDEFQEADDLQEAVDSQEE